MKYNKFKIAVALFISLELLGVVPVMAMNTDFELETINDETRANIVGNLNIILVNTPVKNIPISCFDVNEYGDIALGFNDLSNKSICVYNSDGSFKYGYSFMTNGRFGVEWDEANLIIFFVRGDIAAQVDDNANVIDVKKISNSFQNNSYWNHKVFSTIRTENDTTYMLRNDLGLLNLFAMSTYSKLIKTNGDGSELVLYDVSSDLAIKIITFGIIILFTIIIAVIVILKQFKSLQEQMNSKK
ncbi:MAG: hypothetical protein ACYC5K_00180 [Saccharofermentanales bacterium]